MTLLVNCSHQWESDNYYIILRIEPLIFKFYIDGFPVVQKH
jgi:hypothetical protein